MSVETYQSQPAITLTAAALAHVRENMTEDSPKALRFGADKSGCSGYMYILDFIDQPAEDDCAFQVAEDLTVYIAKPLLPLLHGTHIDYVAEGLNAHMTFTNPNAQGHCGCGESFTV